MQKLQEEKLDKNIESDTIQEITTDVEKHKTEFENAKESFIIEVRDILFKAMGIVRNEDTLSEGLAALDKLSERNLNEREKDRLSVENDSLREVNKILNRKMTEIAEEIKANGTQIDENRKEIERIDKILKIKMKKNKQSI